MPSLDNLNMCLNGVIFICLSYLKSKFYLKKRQKKMKVLRSCAHVSRISQEI